MADAGNERTARYDSVLWVEYRLTREFWCLYPWPQILCLLEIPQCKFIIAGKRIAGYQIRIFLNWRMDVLLRFVKDIFRIPKRQNLWRQSSLVVCPYLDASQSGVVLTAYAFNKPVIRNKCGRIARNMFGKEKTGFIVPPNDPERLCRTIIKNLRKRTVKNRNESMNEFA